MHVHVLYCNYCCAEYKIFSPSKEILFACKYLLTLSLPFLLSLSSKVISEDIEVISEIIPQLESFYTTQRQLLHSATELLEELTAYSPSTNTTEGAEKKKAELQVSNIVYIFYTLLFFPLFFLSLSPSHSLSLSFSPSFLQLLSNKYTQLETQFDSIMSSSTNLTDTLFDQTKFQSDVSCLREKLKECKTMRDEKLKTLKVKYHV